MGQVLALLLAAVFGFLAPGIQDRVRGLLRAHPRAVWAAPLVLTAIFGAASALAAAYSLPLILTVLIYTSAPVACAVLAGSRRIAVTGRSLPWAFDFLAVLLLWLPLEFAAGAALVPRPAQGFLHSVAYGIAILLGLALFLCYRCLPGLKYNLPSTGSDLRLPLAAFAIAAPVLAALGYAIGFIPPPHLPTAGGARMSTAGAVIFVGAALPEEILFRSLIQNLLFLRFGASLRTLAAASLIFGSAHLDNGPQPLPNWRYMIVATIAGIAYGKVFQKSSTVLSSAVLHTMVDWTKHFFF